LNILACKIGIASPQTNREKCSSMFYSNIGGDAHKYWLRGESHCASSIRRTHNGGSQNSQHFQSADFL